MPDEAALNFLRTRQVLTRETRLVTYQTPLRPLNLIVDRVEIFDGTISSVLRVAKEALKRLRSRFGVEMIN